MPSHCPDPEFLSVYLDGQLTSREQTLVEEHLSNCRKCRHLVSVAIKTEDSVVIPSKADQS